MDKTQSKRPVIWSATDAMKAVRGVLHGDQTWAACGVSIDSRTLQPGDLFVALVTDQADGHDYVADALAKGACAALVSRKPDNVTDKKAPLLMAEDTLKALQDLGQAARKRSAAKRIGITGSVGKTGTRAMGEAAFGVLGQVHASEGSYNNHWGVPLSLARMHGGADFGIFEMGMNHANEITPLSKQVRPDIAIITAVESVHIENFENEQGIADAKAEIFDGVAMGGTAILNADNRWFAYLKEKAEGKGLRVLSFGEAKGADARVHEIVCAANGGRARLEIGGEVIPFSLRLAGRHHLNNAAAILLAVHALGQDVMKAAQALGKMEPVAGRGTFEKLDLGDPDNPVTLIDESYNASPAAMNAAFKVLALIDPGRGGRRIAVLGDMLELGRDSARMHADLSLPLQAADVQLVYTSGKMMKHLQEALPANRRGAHTDNSHEMAKIVPDVLSPGDVVMVKGSNGSKMGVVVEALRALPQRLKGR